MPDLREALWAEEPEQPFFGMAAVYERAGRLRTRRRRLQGVLSVVVLLAVIAVGTAVVRPEAGVVLDDGSEAVVLPEGVELDSACMRVDPSARRGVVDVPLGLGIQEAVERGLRDGWALAGPVWQLPVEDPESGTEVWFTGAPVRGPATSSVAVWVSPDRDATWHGDGSGGIAGELPDPVSSANEYYLYAADGLAAQAGVWGADTVGYGTDGLAESANERVGWCAASTNEWPDSVGPPPNPAVDVPPAEELGPDGVWLSHDTITASGQPILVTVVSDVPVSYGLGGPIQWWDGGRWQQIGDLAQATPEGFDPDIVTPMIGLSTGPDGLGAVETIGLPSLEPGWYRFGKQVQDEAGDGRMATATLRVLAEVAPIAPVIPAQPSLVVDPLVLSVLDATADRTLELRRLNGAAMEVQQVGILPLSDPVAPAPPARAFATTGDSADVLEVPLGVALTEGVWEVRAVLADGDDLVAHLAVIDTEPSGPSAVPPTLECVNGTSWDADLDFVEGHVGEATAALAVQGALRQLSPGGDVAVMGDVGTVRVDGRVVAIATATALPNGTYVAAYTVGCSDDVPPPGEGPELSASTDGVLDCRGGGRWDMTSELDEDASGVADPTDAILRYLLDYALRDAISIDGQIGTVIIDSREVMRVEPRELADGTFVVTDATGCSDDITPGDTPGAVLGPCPITGADGANLADFVIVYGQMRERIGQTVLPEAVGPPILTTRCRMQDGTWPDGEFRTGDAGQLSPGTPIHQVLGASPDEVVVAVTPGGIVAYGAATPPPTAPRRLKAAASFLSGRHCVRQVIYGACSIGPREPTSRSAQTGATAPDAELNRSAVLAAAESVSGADHKRVMASLQPPAT